MVFKRLLLNIFGFCLGFAIGIYLAPSIAVWFGFPQTYSVAVIIAAVIAVLFSVGIHLISARIKAATEEINVPKQGWAWLKPAGVVNRSPYPLNKEQVIIGRDINCDIMLKDDSISRRHAEVVRTAEGWMIRDLDSSNGTFVNGQRKEESWLDESDVITLGDINLTFEGPRNPAAQMGPEPISALTLNPAEKLGLDTEVHRLDGDTEVWRPRTAINDPDEVDDL